MNKRRLTARSNPYRNLHFIDFIAEIKQNLPTLEQKHTMKPISQILFWILVVVLLTLGFGFSDHNYLYSFYFVSFLLPVIVGTSYFYNLVLIPRYLLKKKYLKFTLYCIYTLIISMYLETIVIFLAFTLLANYQYQNMNPVTTNIFVLALTLYAVVFLNAFILLVKEYIAGQENIRKLRSEKEKLTKGYLLVRADRKTVRILFEDIEYIESLGDYVKIIPSSGKSIITREKISQLHKRLPSDFLRIHRSFLVNRNKITSFSREEVSIHGTTLPVSRTYKHEVRRKI